MFRSAIVAVGLATGLTACAGSGAPAPENSSAAPPDGRLTVGVMLPASGPDAALSAPMEAGIRVAVREINKAGGVNGERLRVVRGFVEESVAAQSVATVLGRGADVVVGTEDSAGTGSVLNDVTGAGVMFVSPSDTADALAQRDHQGLFWRTAAPDSFQASVVADTLNTAKVDKPALLVQEDSGSDALAAAIQATIESTGGGLAGDPVTYDGNAAAAASARQVRRMRPDGVVLVGDADAAVVQSLAGQRLGPDRRPLFEVGGDLTPADDLAVGVLDGAVGFVPGAELAPDLRKRIAAVSENLTLTTSAPEAYDAVVVPALAAVAAASDRPEAIAGQMVSVTTGGEACDTFAECERLISEGKDVDYDGPSGPIEFQPDGNPGQAVMGVYEFADGEWAPLQYVEGTVPPPAPPTS